MYSSSAPVVSSSRCPDISLAELHRSCRSIWWSLQGFSGRYDCYDLGVWRWCSTQQMVEIWGFPVNLIRIVIDLGQPTTWYGLLRIWGMPPFCSHLGKYEKITTSYKLSGCPANKPRWPSLIWQNFNARLMFKHVQSCLSFVFFLQSFSWNRFFASMLEGFRLNLENHKKKLEENATNIKQSPKIQLFGCPPRPFFMGGLMSTPADAMAFVTEATTPGWQWMNGQRGWSGVDMGTARWDLPSGNFMGFNGI